MAATLVSSARLFTTNGYTTVFGTRALILDRQHRVVASVSCHRHGLYKLDAKILMCTPPLVCALAAASEPLLITWHCRFGHLHPAAIRNLARSGAVTGLELNPSDASKWSDLVCNTCLAGKAHRAPFAGPVCRSDVRLYRDFSPHAVLALLLRHCLC
jgi:hypothetical protein